MYHSAPDTVVRTPFGFARVLDIDACEIAFASEAVLEESWDDLDCGMSAISLHSCCQRSHDAPTVRGRCVGTARRRIDGDFHVAGDNVEVTLAERSASTCRFHCI
jgi:hypothetical protein